MQQVVHNSSCMQLEDDTLHTTVHYTQFHSIFVGWKSIPRNLLQLQSVQVLHTHTLQMLHRCYRNVTLTFVTALHWDFITNYTSAIFSVKSCDHVVAPPHLIGRLSRLWTTDWSHDGHQLVFKREELSGTKQLYNESYTRTQNAAIYWGGLVFIFL